jgi:hypothetical protein
VIRLGTKRASFGQGSVRAIDFHVSDFSASKAFGANVLYPVTRITIAGCSAAARSVPDGCDTQGSTIQFGQSLDASIRRSVRFKEDKGTTLVYGNSTSLSIWIHDENDALNGTVLEAGFLKGRFRRGKGQIVNLDFASDNG